MTEPLTMHQRKTIESESPVKEELDAFLTASKDWGVVESFTRQRENPNPAESRPLTEVELTEDMAAEVLDSSVEQVWGS